MTDIDIRRIEADVLSEAISVVAGAGSLDGVLSTIVRAATRLTSCERGALFLYDDSEGALVPRALIGADWDVYQRIRLRPGEGMSGAVYATGEPQRVGIGSVSSWRSETHALFSRATLGESLGAGCAVPLRLNGRVIGTLAVGTSQRELTDFDISLLERLADQAGMAIERAQRVQELDRRNRELEQKNRLVTAVHRIALSTLVSLERDRIVEDLARSVVEAGMFRSLMVALVHEERGEVEVVRSQVREETGGAGGALTSRADWGTVVGTVYDLDDEDIVAQVARTGKFRDTAFTPGEVSYFIPVKSADRVLAVLATASTAAEKEDVLTRIEAMQPLLDQVAIAIEHSLLHEELRRLSRQLVHTQEESRRVLAAELHDEIGQRLAGVNLLLADAPSRVRGEIRRLIQDLRQISIDLRPPSLDLGIVPALEVLFLRFEQQTGVSVDWRHSGLEERFAPEVETAAYRIVQESLSNVARHAEVKEVHVGLRVTGQELRIQVSDEGVGFDTDGLGDCHAGLKGMAERLRLLGGNLMVVSERDAGTRVTGRIPVSPDSGSDR